MKPTKTIEFDEKCIEEESKARLERIWEEIVEEYEYQEAEAERQKHVAEEDGGPYDVYCTANYQAGAIMPDED
jgi:hypothetical protein